MQEVSSASTTFAAPALIPEVVSTAGKEENHLH